MSVGGMKKKSTVYSLQYMVSRRRQAAAFTLMELLVVIVIIGILAAMIFPVLSSVQERGRQVRCMNNLKQLHTAAMSYQLATKSFPADTDSMEYWEGDSAADGKPSANGWVSSYPDPTGHAWWYEKNGKEGTWSITNGALFKYLGDYGDQSVYVCPSMARHARNNFKDEKRLVTRSYGMNPHLSGKNVLGYGGASRTFLFADQGLIDMGGGRNYLNKADIGPNSGAIPPPGDPYWDRELWENEKTYHMAYNLGVNGVIDFNRNSDKEYIGGYHGRNANKQGESGGRGNVLFVDGHVESVSYLHTDYIGDGDWEDGAPITE